MNKIGLPFIIQNTDGTHWFVTWDAAVSQSIGEVVSFTVAIPRSIDLTIGEVQSFALKRAIQLLQQALPPPAD